MVAMTALAILLAPGIYGMAQGGGTGTPASSRTPQPPAPVTPSVTFTPSASVMPSATPTPLTFATPSAAQPNGALIAQEFSLASLGVRNLELRSPQGSAQFSFEVPDNWLASGNNSLTLNVEYFESGASGELATRTSPPISVLEVRVNGILAQNTSYTANHRGAQQLVIPLPSSVMVDATRPRKSITLSLDARDHCESNLQSHLFIRSDLSFVRFEYQKLPPPLNLALFPRPFYNNPLLAENETVMFVLPQHYTPADVEAAMSLAAALGARSGNQLQIKITTPEALDATNRRLNNLIVFGTPGTNALLDSLYAANQLPTRLEGGRLFVGSTEIASDEGVAQIIAHPEDPMLAIMTFTGATTEAMLKAVRAFSRTGRAFGLEGPLAIIKEVRPELTQEATPSTIQDFGTLGGENITIFGVGSQFADLRFSVPYGQQLSDSAYVELVFEYADTLKEVRSTVNLAINEVPVNSIDIGEGSQLASRSGPHRVRAPIPPNAIRAGEANFLQLQLSTSGNWGCNLPDPSTVWLNVRADSTLNLPLRPVDVNTTLPLISEFPAPFNGRPDLSDVLYVLPNVPSVEDVERALRIFSRIGVAVENGRYFAPRAAFGTLPEGINLAEYHLLVAGRPSNNQFLAELSGKLPQTFVAGSDQLGPIPSGVTLRLPPNFEIGMVQSIRSEWNPNRVVVVMSGNGILGESYATLLMLGLSFGRAELEGNVIYVTNNSIYALKSDARWQLEDAATEVPQLGTYTAQLGSSTPTPNPVFTVTPGATPTQTLPPPSATPTATSAFTPTPAAPIFPTLAPQELIPESPDQPSWLLGLVAITGVVLLGAGAYALLSLLRWLSSRRRAG